MLMLHDKCLKANNICRVTFLEVGASYGNKADLSLMFMMHDKCLKANND
jgi:hypothetical protein